MVPAPLIYFTLWPASLIYLSQLVAFIAATFVLSLPAIRIHVVPTRTKHQRAHAQAMQQFVAHGLHQTENRTGVLIFASVAERYAEIVADAGINAKVQREVWDNAIGALIAGIRDGRAGRRFRGRDRAVRRRAGAALPARRAQPRRTAEQARGDLIGVPMPAGPSHPIARGGLTTSRTRRGTPAPPRTASGGSSPS